MPPDPEVVLHDGPLPPLGDGPLSKAELSFREALEDASKRGSKYSRWAACARADWHKRTGVAMREGE